MQFLRATNFWRKNRTGDKIKKYFWPVLLSAPCRRNFLLIGSKSIYFPTLLVSADGLRKIVEFIYSGEVQIGMDDVEEILDAATHLQMRHIVNFCTEFLIEQVTNYGSFKNYGPLKLSAVFCGSLKRRRRIFGCIFWTNIFT